MLNSTVQNHFQVTLFGTLTRATTLMIGSWDPFLPSHEKVLGELQASAERKGFDAAVVLLDPPPASYLPGNSGWPLYDDVEVRVQRLQRCGIQGVIHVSFEAEHLRLGAADICNGIESVATIGDMWIGPRQTLGRGPQGEYAQVVTLGQERGFEVTRLTDPFDSKDLSGQVRSLVRRGRIRSAQDLVGRAPILARSSAALTAVPWPAGDYQAIPFTTIDDPISNDTVPITLHATEEGFAQFEWPYPTSPYLAFVAGASD